LLAFLSGRGFEDSSESVILTGVLIVTRLGTVFSWCEDGKLTSGCFLGDGMGWGE